MLCPIPAEHVGSVSWGEDSWPHFKCKNWFYSAVPTLRGCIKPTSCRYKQHKGHLNRQALTARTSQGRQAGCNVSRSYETVPASNTAQRFHQYDRTVSLFSSDTIQQYTVALFASPPREIIYP